MAKKGAPRAAGPHKNHGPKRKLFHCWSRTMRIHLSKVGLFNKYNNQDSFVLSCQARGLRHGSAEEWAERFHTFTQLENKTKQDEWLANCKNYVDPGKEKKRKASSK